MGSISLVKQISQERIWHDQETMFVHGAPEGADALAIARAVKARKGVVVHIARDASRAAATATALRYFAGDIPVMMFPAWDCLPYDRASPSPDVTATRMSILSLLAKWDADKPLVLIMSINAVVQRVPPRQVVCEASFQAKPGASVDSEALITFLVANGYSRASTVREKGDFAVRGGLVDIYPPGAREPLRLDFFGDTLESIRAFDPETQRTTAQRTSLDLTAASEILLSSETISRFRHQWITTFGPAGDDPIYEAVSSARKQAGMEHYLPLFYQETSSIFDYLGEALVFTDHLADEALDERLKLVADYYQARTEKTTSRQEDFAPQNYKALAAEKLYLTNKQWTEHLDNVMHRPLSPFAPPEGRAFDFGARQARTFAAERAAGGNIFESVTAHVKALMAKDKRVLIVGWSEGSAARLKTVLEDHGLAHIHNVTAWQQVEDMSVGAVGVGVLGIEQGFDLDDLAIISEQDILGDRLVRRGRKKRADNFLTEASSLSIGDMIVHVDHGIGRYQGLKTLDVSGAPHDCLHLEYHAGDKLFLPVENIELLSRFGSDDPNAQLDRLGGAAWQNRKAKMRARIKMMAEALIKIAASRAMRKVPPLNPPAGLYDEFCARFPFAETQDQENAIDDVLDDLAKGQPMDRLICGDVGFGKTEVALRAAFVVAMSGRQVAIIAPTTLLVRQHFRNFSERFQGYPLKVRQLSRMVSTKLAKETKAGMENGDVDIVIGTHALLAKAIKFRDVAMIIVDEEQHFGVKHKERLKEFRADTHVLTLTATPIPRTLQLSMSGIRDLSLIATPPVDRLAIRTSIGPFDPVVAREILLREHYRGGQSFYVAPRVSDLNEIASFLDEQVPEVKYKIAHGQMASGELEDIMNAFYDGKFDVLVATTIIESGIDVPTANTLLVHRADMFGLAQLYQIRGRVGRSKQRAYAYLTTRARKKITPGAERRLKILQSLDTLGAGFTLASHDLDIRGAGNLLGEEQSGNVKEVGVELYQHMLEEAVSSLKEGGGEIEDTWSPAINIGTAVLLPETYVQDLDVRMSLYRRLSDVKSDEEVEGFGAELIDRFGPLPDEVDYLLRIVTIKALCHRAGVAKIDAGAKGAVISFRHDKFANPVGLIEFVSNSPFDVKVRPDQKLVFKQNWPTEKARLKGCRKIIALLVDIAEDEKAVL